jgi:spermidine/putrescine transport system ATP-binding protein
VQEGEFFSLLGGSGCGKSTILRLVAGFEQPTSGEVIVAGQDHQGATPAYVDRVNMVFQNYALFPHLTARENVEFPLRMAGLGAAERRRVAGQMLELIQMQSFADHRPRQLSGGQQQRIALGRALVGQPKVVLLDEPLGALDLKLRKEMQQELKRIQKETASTFIYVTHDQEEALTMSDRIAIMHRGQMAQVGTPLEIYERPASRYVASFVGECNFLSGSVAPGVNGVCQIELGHGRHVTATTPRQGAAAGQAVVLSIRPEKIRLRAADAPTGTEANEFAGVIEHSVFYGAEHLHRVRLGHGLYVEVREPNRDRPRWAHGSPVRVAWAAEAVSVLMA